MKDAVGHGILIAYNAFGPFVYKAVGVGGMLHQQVVVGLFQQFGARYVIVLFQEGFEVGGNAFFSGMPAMPSGKSMMRRHSSKPKLPNRKKASRGAVAIQLGLPRPAFSMVRAVFFRLSSAMSIRRFFSSKGLIDSIFFSKSFVSISSSLGSLFIVFSHSVNNLCSCGILFLSLLEINRPIYVSFSSDSC